MENVEITLYPHPKDDMWNQECEALIPFLSGKGIDIGCSNRSIFKEDVRQDIDKEMQPELLCSGDELPCKDEEFDYLTSIHTFEHFKDQIKMLTEWARVIKKGGIIAIVHPDVNHTGIYRPDGLKEGENPYYEHHHEKTYADFLAWFKKNNSFGLSLVDSGVACPNWSFYIILKKNGHPA